jgi:hypothetical protein
LLIHEVLLVRNTFCVGLHYAASWHIMPAVDGAAFVAVQVASVAGKSD